MTGSAFRWRCRKIVHHFVMFHGYRSARGRVASHSVQPARNGAYHEGRVGIIPGGHVGRGLRIVRYGPRWSSVVLIYRTRPACSSSLERVERRCRRECAILVCVYRALTLEGLAGCHSTRFYLFGRGVAARRSVIPTPTYLVSPRVSIYTRGAVSPRSFWWNDRVVESAYLPTVRWLRMIVFSDKRKWRPAN